MDFFHVVADCRTCRFATDGFDDVFELLAVFTALDSIDVSTDEFDIVLFQNAGAVQLDGGIQRGLATQGCQDSVDGVSFFALFNQDLLDELWLNGLHIGVVSKLRVGHDGGRVGVNQRYTQSFFFEDAASLGAGVVEFTGLADDNRAGADDQDVVNIVALWHGFLFLPFLVGIT